MFKITNRHGTTIWEGEAYSFYDAWHKMFEDKGYPQAERLISTSINIGLWIERK